MFSVEIDEKKNRIYITLGEIRTGDGKKLLDDIKKKTRLLKPGFTGVSNITSFKIIDSDEPGLWTDQVLKTLADSGMVRAVRVTNSVASTKETKEKHGYMLSLAVSVEEADRFLDACQK